jgi:hypothetical protein
MHINVNHSNKNGICICASATKVKNLHNWCLRITIVQDNKSAIAQQGLCWFLFKCFLQWNRAELTCFYALQHDEWKEHKTQRIQVCGLLHDLVTLQSDTNGLGVNGLECLGCKSLGSECLGHQCFGCGCLRCTCFGQMSCTWMFGTLSKCLWCQCFGYECCQCTCFGQMFWTWLFWTLGCKCLRHQWFECECLQCTCFGLMFWRQIIGTLGHKCLG